MVEEFGNMNGRVKFWRMMEIVFYNMDGKEVGIFGI